MLLTINNLDYEYHHLVFSSAYHLKQSESLLNQINVYIDSNIYDIDSNHQIYFNHQGKVNMAQSISSFNHHYLIRLGFGNLKYE